MMEKRSEEEKLLFRFQAACVRREYCVSDMRKKILKAVENDARKAEDLLSKLVEDRFVSDSRYAAAFAREKASISGWGPAKIRYALSGKGIASSVIAEALEEIDGVSASRRMNKVLEAKWKLLKDDPQGKYKLIRFGLSRGYSYDSVSEFLSELQASVLSGESL